MLNFNQVVLTGDKCKNLKVRDPGKYRFVPRDLLSSLVDIYLHLGREGKFVEACAADGRSYRREVFEKTVGILRKYKLKTAGEIEAFERLGGRIEMARVADEEGEEALGDIPEEFLGTPTPFAGG
jgi:ubiquitin conjugation factor E4 B